MGDRRQRRHGMDRPSRARGVFVRRDRRHSVLRHGGRRTQQRRNRQESQIHFDFHLGFLSRIKVDLLPGRIASKTCSIGDTIAARGEPVKQVLNQFEIKA